MPSRKKIDRRKRDALIRGVLGGQTAFDPERGLTDGDRRAIAAVHAEERAAAAAGKTLEELVKAPAEGWASSPFLSVLTDLQQRHLGGEGLNIAPMINEGDTFETMSVAETFEGLLRRQRAQAAGPVPTVDVGRFFDGNNDRTSIAANVVDADGGPTFDAIRDTLLSIAARRAVSAVGVEIGELPNPEHRGDDDVWLSAERVFVWTTAPAKDLRQWTKPLAADGIAREPASAASPPPGTTVAPKSRLYVIAWD